jgi:hypothetical protein
MVKEPECLLPAGATNNKQKLYVSWAGAGIFFFWQLGMPNETGA